MERLRALLRKSKSKQKKTCTEQPLSSEPSHTDTKKQVNKKSPREGKKSSKSSAAKQSKPGKITIITSKPPSMTDEEFHAFIRRLKYYNLEYFNFKMYVGVDENCISDDTKSVMANIKKAIRRNLKAYKGTNITEDSIIENSVYGTDQIKILKLETILEPIDETKPMVMAA